MPPKHKKHSAIPKERRHENGLAPPGKQIRKQRSDGQLNGHSIKTIPAQGLSDDCANLTSSGPNLSAAAPFDDPRANGPLDAAPMGVATALEGGLLPSRMPQHYTADMHADRPAVDSLDLSGSDLPAQPDAIIATPAVPSSPSTLDAPYTLIGHWTLVDVLAIFLVLMQLPPLALLAVESCFAFLTFGTPPTGWSLSSIASIHDWLQSHGGNPSMLTMLVLDLFFFFGWGSIPHGKDLVLDLAQAVVAISLGGGAAGDASKRNTLTCVAILVVHHGLRQKTIRDYAVSALCFVLSRTRYGPLEPSDFPWLAAISSTTERGRLRTFLELHILTQGIVRIIRRYLVKASSSKPTNNRLDLDYSHTNASLPSVVVASPSVDGARNASTDSRQPGPSPAQRDKPEKSVSSGRKRRRQATLVRSQQPFWAAIASTKVTVSKEIEQSQASRDYFESGANSVEQLGNGLTNCLDDRIWISDIHDSEVWFTALFFSPAKSTSSFSSDNTPTDTDSSAGGVSDLIVVRVNGADWSSTSVVSGGQRQDRTVLTGKVFGLTPSSIYKIEFIRAQDGVPLHEASLRTRHIANTDQIPVVPPPAQTLRPSSPATTLKQSIAAAEAALTEHRNQSKKTKKDHRTTANALKKEVESIEGRLSSCGGNDDRQRQRQFQYKQNIKLAEDTFSSIVEEIENLGDIPQPERDAAARSKEKWTEQQRIHRAIREELDTAKANRDRQFATVRTEGSQQQQKHDRLTARLAKLRVQREGLLAAQRDQEKREQLRSIELASKADMERKMLTDLKTLETQRTATVAEIANLEHQLYSPTNGFVQPFASSGTPQQTPESSFAALALGNGRAPPSLGGVGAYQQPFGTSQAQSRRGSLIAKNRGRSSSMLSNVSAFTDDEIGGPLGNGHSVNGFGGDTYVRDNGRPESGDLSNRISSASPVHKLGPIGGGRISPRDMQG